MPDKKLSDAAVPAVSVLQTDTLVRLVQDPTGTPNDAKTPLELLVCMGQGKVSVKNGVGSQVVSASVWTKLTQFTAELSAKNLTASHANDKLTTIDAGTYFVRFNGSFTAGAGLFEIAIYYDGVEQAVCSFTNGADATAHFQVSCEDLIVAAAAKDFEIYFRVAVGATIACKNASLLGDRRV